MSADAEFTIPGYQIESLIGQGAFARVYVAVQPQYARRVAVKVLDANFSDERLRRQFERECAATGGLAGHPNILIVLDAGFTSSGKPYLTGSYCEEGSVADRVARDGPMAITEVLRIGVKLAGALDTAHRAGLVHRDVKPENVLLSGFGEPMLADWGIATITSRLSTKVTMAAMTPSHAAPEVLEGNPSSTSSDLYSLGSTLYALLAGRPPFSMDGGHNILTLMVKAASEPVPPIPRADVPPALFDALVHAMAKRPEDRPESAAAFGHALQQVQYQMGLPYTELITRSPGQGTGPVPAADVAAARLPSAAEQLADGPGAGGTVIRPASARRGVSVDPSQAETDSLAPTPETAAGFGWGADEPPAGSGQRPDVLDPTSTVMHERHAPVIERPDVPVADKARGGKRGLVVAVVVVVLVLGGVGAVALVRQGSGASSGVAVGDPSATVSTIRGGNGVGSGGATGSAPAGGNPGDPSTAVVPPASVSGPPTTSGGVTSSTAGGTSGPKPPRAVSVERTTEGLQVQWEDDNGGRYPSVFEVLSPDGKLVSKVSAIGAGTRTAVVTETLEGPLSVTEEYCVAVGTIASSGKPVWSAARCTDGSEIPVV